MQRVKILGLVLALAGAAACSSDTRNPASPSATTTAATGASNPDGSTLKVTAPTVSAPANGGTLGSTSVQLVVNNAQPKFVSDNIVLTYRFQLFKSDDPGTAIFEAGGVQQGAGTTGVAPTVTFENNVNYRWRARAEFGNAPGPWSDFFTFKGPEWVPGQPFGPIRNIGIGEALSIIEQYHNDIGANLGGGSTRESRVDFWWRAMALVHYGHPRWNPAGGDRLWCVKDGGSGRPPSDDVAVRCDTRDFWDCIGGAGAPGYTFRAVYDHILPSDQNVYPPPLSYLPR
ncbi:MAG: hypothetical protein KJ061_03805 [Vicinamibacteraceae bacterium]|nr:hypothetical protein [Vicinamibacteraceae bacterium]